ncbi:hypothetical protein PSHT_00270, partial [Puccinia striiformis]
MGFDKLCWTRDIDIGRQAAYGLVIRVKFHGRTAARRSIFAPVAVLLLSGSEKGLQLVTRGPFCHFPVVEVEDQMELNFSSRSEA